MDNLLDRFGLYDFFGLLLPGVSFMIFLYYIDFPLIIEGHLPSSQTFIVIIFVVESYIVGTLIQEVSSFLDRKYTKMRINATEKFFDPKKRFFKDEELNEVIKVANRILGKSEKNEQFTNSECSKFFFQCKTYLENNEKSGKANKLDALFAMSRDFVVCNICMIICQAITFFYESWYGVFRWSFSFILIFIYLTISSFIFYRRAYRYSKLRTRTIIRQYIDLKR